MNEENVILIICFGIFFQILVIVTSIGLAIFQAIIED